MPIEPPARKSATSYDRRAELLRQAVGQFHTMLVRYAYSYTRHWQDAENIVQELWKYAIVYLPEEKMNELALLRWKVQQLFKDHYRAAQRRPAIVTDELPERPDTRHQGVESSEAALKEQFFEQFHDLPLRDDQRDVFWLHARYGFTYQEIAEKTGKAVSTIGDWVALARKVIAEQLSEGGK